MRTRIGLAITILLLAASAQGQQLYRLTDLGDFPGSFGSEARAINEAGQIVGESIAAPANRSFIWDETSGLVDLGSFPGAQGVHARDIEDSGVVTGYTSGGVSRGFLYAGGPLADLGVPAGGQSSAGYALNNAGRVVGSSGANAADWTGGAGMQFLIDPGGLALRLARDVNASGTVAGLTVGDNAFVLVPGQNALSLGRLSPAHIQSDAFGVNDLGAVVGYSRPDSSTARGFIWQPGGALQDIGALDPSDDLIQPLAINNAGQVVGLSANLLDGARAFLWSDADGMQNLNDLVDPADPLASAVTLTIGHDINESGQIAADGFIGGFIHAFLLTPTSGGDPPETFVFDFSGPLIDVTDFPGTATFEGLLVGNTMSGRFIVGAGEDGSTVTPPATYEFPSSLFYGVLSDGSTYFDTEGSMRNVEVTFGNDLVADADLVDFINAQLGTSLPPGTVYDSYEIETDMIEGTRRLEIGVSMISLDTSFIVDGSYFPTPSLGAVDLAVYFLFEEDDGVEMFDAIGLITGQTLISGTQDTDMDGVPDYLDNCIEVSNGPLTPNIGVNSQRDTDDDGFGNICDPDLNNDGIVNSVDLGIFKSRFFSADPDADFNGDGVVNPVDLGIFKSYFFLPPGPSGLVL